MGAFPKERIRYGGIAVLGVNVFDMAFPAVIRHYLFRPMIARGGIFRSVGAFGRGALSVSGAAILTSLALGFTNEGLWTSAKILLAAHAPIMALEGCVVALVVAFVVKTRPELLESDDAPEMGVAQ